VPFGLKGVCYLFCFEQHYFSNPSYEREQPEEKVDKDEGDDVTGVIRAKGPVSWGGSPDSGVNCLGLDSGSAAHRLHT